jgi:hypothetical protein
MTRRVDQAKDEGEPTGEAETHAALLPLAAQIEQFLAGRTTGRALLEALYNAPLDEEVPARLKDLLPR